ncbi:CPXV018 protein [Cowpox virus]|uniref:CPXV018 protein n=1 Tax=Cowpox virus (strain Brighton Red) TaxID=265872 RepID=Q8QN43_CWPXB|nr:CPXV018 protein [Cowpox virus]AAM13465.1 CPXV018 protein [Cowpox virus]UWJ24768.1 CPXV018 [Cowpox virus]
MHLQYYAISLVSLVSLIDCHKLAFNFNLEINGSDTHSTVDVYLDDSQIITFDGKDIRPTIPFMIGDEIFLPFYKNVFSEFFSLFRRVPTSTPYEDLTYFYECDYTDNKSTFDQFYLYNGEEYTVKTQEATNKNMWLTTSEFRLKKWFDGEDCIMHLRSLVRKMEDSKRNTG